MYSNTSTVNKRTYQHQPHKTRHDNPNPKRLIKKIQIEFELGRIFENFDSTWIELSKTKKKIVANYHVHRY